MDQPDETATPPPTARTQSYCPAPAAPAGRVDGPPYADCLECGRPTEYGVATPGVVLCPVCEWQDAQRTACSG
ncbi:hypothetical protein PV721_11210 [Streptomyces sp. MB09-01]|uniref:hypothetical protein n=1 Tax=Streptomyces sp. MB09-01 TaxID=3028666 RepID=UPI0029B814CE|nr:hypothetical protein [Streptomyces sp. MB09-01]MDX3534929.1 hypothetical protein [Streptomyces sp. MB09-01]